MNSQLTPPLIAPVLKNSNIGGPHFFMAGLAGATLACALYIASFFHLDAGTRALRASIVRSLGGHADQKIALHVGSLTMSLVHGISRLVNLEPEPRAILDSIRGAEVGVYALGNHGGSASLVSTLASADHAMQKRGWTRVVGVVENDNLVAVYVPTQSLSPARVRCCVMVLNEQNLVIASVAGNLRPLMTIAQSHLNPEKTKRLTAELTKL